VKKGEPLSDTVVREYAPRLRFLPLAPFPPPDSDVDDCMQPSSSNTDKSSYKTHDQSMIVPVDGHWLNLMTGKRFHVNNCSNSNSENDSNSTCSYESSKPTETEEQHSPSLPTVSCTATQSDTKADIENEDVTNTTNEATPTYEIPPVPSLVQCSKISNDDVATPSYQSEADTSMSKSACTININTHNSRIATMNLEVSKLSTKNIIEHSKIMSLQHMNRMPAYNGHFLELDSSGDEASRRGTLDTFIPPLKDFQGINNPFLTQFKYPSKKALVSSKQNGRQNHLNARFSLPLPMQYNTMMAPFVRPKKRKLSEKDIVIGPNGEVKRRKFRRPRKYLQLQNGMPAPQSGYVNKVKIHGRRLRQRQEKNYYENSRRNNTNNNNSASINSVKSLQLSPHKGSCSTVEVDAEQLSALKTSVQSYFRAGQTFKVLARRGAPDAQPAYLIEWDTTPTVTNYEYL
ncbi:Metal-response element-binding transcription factor 2, partial [Operophtera brumata]